MCGIVGYVGPRLAQAGVIDGLRRLEYRGYDSAGVALVDGASTSVAIAKRAGKLGNLDKLLAEEPMGEAVTGIGHTRWATHGAPNDVNAHPHTDCTGRVAVVHNGIIENFARLRADAEAAGHEMVSETDTEVVAHLLEDQLKTTPELGEALRLVCRRLDGAFTLVVVDAAQPHVVAAARRSSPLVVGRGDGENYIASDVVRRDYHHLVPTTSTGTPRRPRRAVTAGSCSRRSTSSHRPSPTRCSAGTPRTARCSWTRCGCPTTSCARSTR
jgi:glucosamine--fructose-6-phosphate aminotransferase (isomerizing)